MCLTIPKKVLKIKGDSVIVEDHNGNRQELKTIVELAIGDFVISQQNMVLEKVDREFAQETINLLTDNGRV